MKRRAVGHHSLTLTDRGGQHIHRWQASCVCGWVGIPLRRRKGAEDAYHGHAGADVRRAARLAHDPAHPGTVTPQKDWPTEWRHESLPAVPSTG